MGQLLGIGILVVLVLAGIPLWQRQKRKFKSHQDEMHAWATSHGCSYVDEDNSQCSNYSFYPFGHDNQGSNRVITGKYADRPIAAYDYYFGAGETSTVYFAMIVMDLPTKVPWLHVGERAHMNRNDKDHLIETGDETFDDVYGVLADDAEYAKSALSATVRSGLPAHELSGMHVEYGRVFLWRTRRKHDVALLEDRLRFAATVASELPAPQ